MIRVRHAESDAGFEAWSRIKRAVLPNEWAWTVQEFRERADPETLVLVAELDGDIVGAGMGGRIRPLCVQAALVASTAPAARVAPGRLDGAQTR